MSGLALWLYLGFGASLGWAMLADLIRLEIPDGVHVAVLVFFGLAALNAGFGWGDILRHVGAATVLFLLGAWLFSLGVWGGGDVKLAAAVALWIGFPGVLQWLLLTSLAGGVLALAILALRHVNRTRPLPPPIGRLAARTEGIPYAIALAAAGLWVARPIDPGIYIPA